jgi:hypothetical protein
MKIINVTVKTCILLTEIYAMIIYNTVYLTFSMTHFIHQWSKMVYYGPVSSTFNTFPGKQPGFSTIFLNSEMTNGVIMS